MKFPYSFILEYPAWWDGISRCNITVYRPQLNLFVVLATERSDNPGIHIRQASANLATTLYYRLDAWLQNTMLPQNIIWIEHDPAEPVESARWQRIILRWETNRYFEYDRHSIKESDVQHLTAGQWRAVM